MMTSLRRDGQDGDIVSGAAQGMRMKATAGTGRSSMLLNQRESPATPRSLHRVVMAEVALRAIDVPVEGWQRDAMANAAFVGLHAKRAARQGDCGGGAAGVGGALETDAGGIENGGRLAECRTKGQRRGDREQGMIDDQQGGKRACEQRVRLTASAT